MGFGTVVIVALPFLIAATAIALPLLLKYRLEMARLRKNPEGSDEALLGRIEALERKCEALQEQVNDAHAQLVDERRALDQKLAGMLPPLSSTAESESTPRRVAQGQGVRQ